MAAGASSLAVAADPKPGWFPAQQGLVEGRADGERIVDGQATALACERGLGERQHAFRPRPGPRAEMQLELGARYRRLSRRVERNQVQTKAGVQHPRRR